MIIGLLVIERILEFTNHVMPYRRLLSTRAQLDHVFCVAPFNQKHARSTLHELKSLRNAQTNVPFIVTDRILDKQGNMQILSSVEGNVVLIEVMEMNAD